MPFHPDPIDANFDGAWLELEDGRKWVLDRKCTLGRGAENHIIIDSPKASRSHAAVHLQDGVEWWVLDSGSRNGTFRNEHRVVRPTRLRDGDCLSAGGQTFLFRQPSIKGLPTDTTGAHLPPVGGDATVLDLRQHQMWLFIADIENFTELNRDWELDRLARSISHWLQEGDRIVQKHRGRLAKYLGDGFLAGWVAGTDLAKEIVGTLQAFQRLRQESEIPFRVALHYGQVTFSEQATPGEVTMLGPDMIFIFRLEELASELGVSSILSAAAQKQLAPHMDLRPVPGEHEIKGYGACRCFTLGEEG